MGAEGARRGTRGTGLLLLVLALSSCAIGTRPDPFRRGGEAAGGRVLLRAENLSFNDATLHALGPRGRTRIGTISGKASQTLSIPWTGFGDLRIEIDLLAGGSYTTSGVSVYPGDQVYLLIQENVRYSTLRR